VALYVSQGWYAEAEPFYQHFPAIREKALGPRPSMLRIIRLNDGPNVRFWLCQTNANQVEFVIPGFR
jgi:hypothetical protein